MQDRPTCGFLHYWSDLWLDIDHILSLVLHVLHIASVSNHVLVERLGAENPGDWIAKIFETLA